MPTEDKLDLLDLYELALDGVSRLARRICEAPPDTFLSCSEPVVARDGIGPPTPAFSGPPSNETKWSGISGYH
jgi:hypothetical protein